MPELQKVLTEIDVSTQRAHSVMDLAPYLSIIESIQSAGGVGAQVALSEGEARRTEKRRLSLAAKEKSFKLTWRKAPEGFLKFVLSQAGQPAPGGRTRRK